ncbi:Resolvase domain protein [Desulfatibacillum aliphaticivorans]|uniref:Resolvase domain protein n=1 Tax=Desulfatibacillum aliphaticivorans TaxID=218208 RepID=B8FB35_DESAL|nr:recombinase family protein [Desulfatibacillum aliphaticivorans]ACL04121.1 Resolvase domain protein [Desulfatibacillum aliphaticivorans]
MEKCFAYLRVSGQGQIDGNGFDRQIETIRAFADSKGFEVVSVYQDGGISGTTGEDDRPAFKSMVADILKNGVRIILVESLDRLAREYRIQEQLLIYLVSKGTSLVSANTGENVTEAIMSDPMRKAMVQIQGVFSELDKSLLVNKLKKAREKVRQDKGKCEGAKRYGENSEAEQAVIRHIRALRRNKRGGKKGLSYQAIADTLNAEGYTTKRGKQWGATQVRRVLHP